MVNKETRLEALAREQREFERQLPDLIRSHAGKVALFQGGEAVDFFDLSEAGPLPQTAQGGAERGQQVHARKRKGTRRNRQPIQLS